MREYFKSDIVRLSKTVESIKEFCVYFLIYENDIVYVGFSSDVQYRLRAHKSNKKFDRYYFIKVDDVKSGLELEKSYIQKFKPAYNLAYNDENMAKNKTKRKELCKINSNTIEDIKEIIKQENKKIHIKESVKDESIIFLNVEPLDIKYNLLKNTYCKKIINGVAFYAINYNGVFYKCSFENKVKIIIEKNEYQLSGIYGELK